MTETALSINRIPIRLTDERWRHIVENHVEMAGHFYDVLDTVSFPALVVGGHQGELLATRPFEGNKYIVVVYKEVSGKDGFVITAFFTSRMEQIEKRGVIWRKPRH